MLASLLRLVCSVFIRGYERQVGFKFNFNMNVVEKPATHATSVKEFFENGGNISPASIKVYFFTQNY